MKEVKDRESRKRMMTMPSLIFSCLLFLIVLLLLPVTDASSSSSVVTPEVFTPKEEIAVGQTQLKTGSYEAAASSFWSAIMRNDNSLHLEELKNALELFLISYKKQGIPEEGFLKIGQQFVRQGLVGEGVNYLTSALALNPRLLEAHMVLMKVQSLEPAVRLQHIVKALELDPLGYKTHFEVGSQLFSLGSWDSSLAIFEKAFLLNNTCWQSLASLVYLRTYVCKWGNFGAQHHHDLTAIEQIIYEEGKLKESQKNIMIKSPLLSFGQLSPDGNGGGDVLPPIDEWTEHSQATLTSSSIHVHMLLGYNIPSKLKLKVARMHTEHEQALVLRSGLSVFSHTPSMYAEEIARPDFRIKVGYVSANIKSKTTVYMAQDLFRFHDRDRFEVHVYATTPNDNPHFLETAMGGVNWREKVRSGVEHFHEVSGMDVKQVSELIRDHGIHILVDWDGHSNNMVRLSGLFPMQPAPIQVGHQEFIGTTGASYIQYLITDKIASPPELQHLYSEKFIYMPHTFLANSMAYLAPHINPPTLRKETEKDRHSASRNGGGSNGAAGNGGTPGGEKKKTKRRQTSKKDKTPKSLTNNPQANGCGGPPADFVYCNFNKHLKFSPDVFRSWLTILQNVDDSILCLLHNPQDSEKYIMSFVNDFDESLASRVRFLPFVASPFDNQKRLSDMCNVALDTPIYNGHTCSVDALWGGVPLVVFGNTVEMASRVGMSMMSTLGLPEMIATNQDDYIEIAIRLGEDSTWYRSIRRQLVNTCYQNDPMNPLWDLRQYVIDLEMGMEMVWLNFLAGNPPQNADVAAFKTHLNITLHDQVMKSMSTKKKTKKATKSKGNKLQPLLQAIKNKKSLHSPHDQDHHLHSSLNEITQGLWDIYGGLDEIVSLSRHASGEEEQEQDPEENAG